MEVEPDIDIEAGSERRLVGDEARDAASSELMAGNDAPFDGDNEIEPDPVFDAKLVLDTEILGDDDGAVLSLDDIDDEVLCDDDGL